MITFNFHFEVQRIGIIQEWRRKEKREINLFSVPAWCQLKFNKALYVHLMMAFVGLRIVNFKNNHS